DQRPGFPALRPRREGLHPAVCHREAISEADYARCGVQETRLLADGLHEERALQIERDRQRETGKSAAAAQIEEFLHSPLKKQRSGRQAVEDVLSSDTLRITDRGQVDCPVPGQQQPDVAVDGGALTRLQVDLERCEARRERASVRGRKGGKAVDTRRERFAAI